jgi:hypothetical protein
MPPPLSGLAPSRPGPPDRDDPGTMCETTKPGFALGASAFVWSDGEVHLTMLALTR